MCVCVCVCVCVCAPLTFNDLPEDNSRALDPKNWTNDTTSAGTVKLIPSKITFSAKIICHTYSDTLIALVEGADHHNNFYVMLCLQSDQRSSLLKEHRETPRNFPRIG